MFTIMARLTIACNARVREVRCILERIGDVIDVTNIAVLRRRYVIVIRRVSLTHRGRERSIVTPATTGDDGGMHRAIESGR
jgi:hypothetical protein